jgi:serine phosphatase RsbU (regulator of sigma subunit)
MAAFLRELTRQREPYPLTGKVTLIGRDPAAHVVVGTGQTSWHHAIIVLSGGVYYIEDVDSVNGTYVNGQRILERTRLRNNDRIEICGLSVVFQDDAPRPGPLTQEIPVSDAADIGTSTILTTFNVAEVRTETRPEEKLRAVLEIARHLSNALNLQDVLPKILESLFNVFPHADRGFVLLRNPSSSQLEAKAIKYRGSQGGGKLEYSKNIVSRALESGQAILSKDAVMDFDISQSVRRFDIRSVMCVPMVSQSGVGLGVIQIDTRDTRHTFSDGDLEVLVSATAQAARAVEVAQLHHELSDLEAATQIQKSFLPATRPGTAALRFFDYYSSARQIGGDYYDYIPLPGNRLAVAVGDVEGKGVPAALLMARLSIAARFALTNERSVPDAVRRLNAVLTQTGGDTLSVTFAVCVIDLTSFTMTVVNAGHPRPLRRRRASRAVEMVGDEIGGCPLGYLDEPYEALTVALEPGDTLVLFTDGVTDALNPAREQYGDERLRLAIKNGPEEVEALGQHLLADVHRFASGQPPSDDLTVVCFGRR